MSWVVPTESETNMDRLGIEFLSVFGLPPVEFVELAADLGCHYISTGLGPGPAPFDPPPYPPFSLADDPGLRRDMIAAMSDRDVSISLGEGLLVHPGIEVQDHAPSLDDHGGARDSADQHVLARSRPDRAIDQFGALVEMAAARGMETTLETSPGFTPEDLPTALQILGAVGRPDFRLLIDTMHVVRGGSAPLTRCTRPRIIGYVHSATCHWSRLVSCPTTRKHCSTARCRARASSPCSTSWRRCPLMW